MMTDCGYTQYLKELYEKMSSRGIFLTVRSRDGKVNTMTLGWASIGWQWSRPVATVLVRESRYTHALMENAESFTLSVPKDGGLDGALNLCGTKSGRDMDKFAACGITALPGRTVDSPVIGEAWLHYECRIVGSSLVTKDDYGTELYDRVYADNGDMHQLYFGQITACYTL